MRLIFPFATRRDAPISQRFGERPEYYRPLTNRPGHSGIDFAVPEGTPVRCMGVTEGIVTLVDKHGQGPLGLYCYIEHEPTSEYPAGYATLYAHLSRRSLNRGNQVSPGQHIGLSGNTGRSTGPHLHAGFKDLRYKDDSQRYNGYLDFEAMLCRNDEDLDVDVYVPHAPHIRERYGLSTEGEPEARKNFIPGGHDVRANYMDVSGSQKEADRRAMNAGAPVAHGDLPMSPVKQHGPLTQIKDLGRVNQEDSAPKAAVKHIVREGTQWVRPLIALLAIAIPTICGGDLKCERMLNTAVEVVEAVDGKIPATVEPSLETGTPTPVPVEISASAPENGILATPDRWYASGTLVTISNGYRIRELGSTRSRVVWQAAGDTPAFATGEKQWSMEGTWIHVTAVRDGYNVSGWVHSDGVEGLPQ